jgi:membrane protein implicated in regulation of membrane protease activity
MNLEEIEIILFEFKLISFLFLAITSLIVFIWKSESKRRDKNRDEDNNNHKEMFDRHGKILEEIKVLTAVHEVEIKNLKREK